MPNGDPTQNQGRFQYTGQAWLPELGMFYYKARIYSPTLGRFLQTDPIGNDDQVNLYAYVGNDPVNHSDPTGMCTGSKIQNKSGECFGGGFIQGAGSCSGSCSTRGFSAMQSSIRRESTQIAKRHRVNIAALRNEAAGMTRKKFVDAVRTGGKWDFKNNPNFKDVPAAALDRFGNFMFGVAARANGFSLTATVAGAGAYQNLRQGYNGTANGVRGNLDAIASIRSQMFTCNDPEGIDCRLIVP